MSTAASFNEIAQSAYANVDTAPVALAKSQVEVAKAPALGEACHAEQLAVVMSVVGGGALFAAAAIG